MCGVTALTQNFNVSVFLAGVTLNTPLHKVKAIADIMLIVRHPDPVIDMAYLESATASWSVVLVKQPKRLQRMPELLYNILPICRSPL